MESKNTINNCDNEENTSDQDQASFDIEELVNPYVFDTCIGKITGFDADQNLVWVDFSGNPFGKPVAAKIARPFTVIDLQEAIDNVLDIKLEFQNNNPEEPVIKDIYYSILSERPNRNENHELKDIYLKGRRIVIEADTEIIIQSGDTSISCSAEDGKLVTRGVNIVSEALHNNKIKGASVAIN